MSYNRNSPGALLGLAGIIPNPHIGTIQRQLEGGLGGAVNTGQGPLSPAAQAMQTQATQYRPPTATYERSVFGNQFVPTTQEDKSQYNQQWLGDQRNQGFGQGQVDPGLAQAATEAEGGGGEGGGK